MMTVFLKILASVMFCIAVLFAAGLNIDDDKNELHLKFHLGFIFFFMVLGAAILAAS